MAGKKKGNKYVSGRVEVRSTNGRWGSVCDDDFDDDDAKYVTFEYYSNMNNRQRRKVSEKFSKYSRTCHQRAHLNFEPKCREAGCRIIQVCFAVHVLYQQGFILKRRVIPVAYDRFYCN